jgi:hypothetical protein
MCKTALELVVAASVWTSPNRGARAVQRTTKPLGRSQVNPGRVVRAGADSARPPELTWAIGVRIATREIPPKAEAKNKRWRGRFVCRASFSCCDPTRRAP